MIISDASAPEPAERLLQPAPLRRRLDGRVAAALPQPGPRAPRARARQPSADLALLRPAAVLECSGRGTVDLAYCTIGKGSSINHVRYCKEKNNQQTPITLISV